MLNKFILFGVLGWLCIANSASANQDPTKPLNANFQSSTNTAKKSRLVLQSIIQGNGKPRAIINGKMMKVGAYISGYKLVSITKNSVLLVSAERELQLPLFSGAVIK